MLRHLCKSLLLSAALGVFGTLPASPALAAPLATDPVLALSAGMHTAMLKGAASDRQGKYLVTAADDKTARLWDTRTGKMLNVFRPPWGAGTEGQLNAVAIAPDAGMLALAGDTSAGEATRSIYLFDRASGKLLRRLKDFPGEINRLVWSADGLFLAALGKEGGLRVYRSKDWTLVGKDADYPAEGNDLSFAPDNRLASTSMDGQIRLYAVTSSGLQRLGKAKAAGSMPFGLAFSPDGRNLAVTYLDAPRLDVRSGTDLSEQFNPSTQGIARNDGGFTSVVWSPNGQILYAAGQPRQKGKHVIRAWMDAGRGSNADIAITNQVVMSLVALADGRILYASADPSWGMVFPTGTVFELGKPPIADLRPGGRFEAFGVSREGKVVSFGFNGMANDTASFDIDERLLKTGAAPDSVKPPVQTASGWSIANWRNSEKPQINGRSIALRPQETARSYALSHTGDGLVLGADFTLRRFDSTGKQIWEYATPGIAWGVNVTADGRFAVAAYGDGTIRWHSYSDGRELVALFPHADRKRWVQWTPTGIFDASPGGDELFGWHLNRGKEQAADFFPASRFRDRFFHPELIARIFEPPVIEQAKPTPPPPEPKVDVAKILPPVVDIVSPADGSGVSSTSQTARIRLRTAADAPVTEIRVRVNGQAVGARITGTGDTREVTFGIPERNSEVQFFASSKHGTSTPAILRLEWKGIQPAPAAKRQPKLYLLAAGVSDYVDPELKLGLAAKDARDFSSTMRTQKGLLYESIEDRVLLDRDATKANILAGLKWLGDKMTDDDVALVFLAGHGMNDSKEGYLYLPADSDRRRINLTTVRSADIVNTLSKLPGRVVAFIDTCHSGNVLAAGNGASFKRDTTKMVNELSSPEHGVVVFTSATGSQYALESPSWGNGAFTKALVEGLLGEATDRKQKNLVMERSLEGYVGDRVASLTRNQQTPTKISPQAVQDFPLAKIAR